MPFCWRTITPAARLNPLRTTSALNVIGVRVIDHLIFAGNSVYSMTQNSQFDGRQSEEEISYLMRSRNVPGRRGTLREEQEDELMALDIGAADGR